MTSFPTVRVAAAQATPVLLDAEATIDRAVGLVAEALIGGASMTTLTRISPDLLTEFPHL